MHLTLTPSMVAVTLQVPFPTPVTVPSEETEATLGLLELQDAAALVPWGISRKVSPTFR